MSITNKTNSSEQRVLIFSAQTPPISNKQIHFLISQKQMEDILMETSVWPVPFAPSFIEGVAEWRKQFLPVISLEACMGLEPLNSTKTQRLMVIRAIKDGAAPMGFYRLMLRVVPPVRMIALPIECTPASHEWIPKNFFAKGVYEWEDRFLVVAHLKNIFVGTD